MTRPRKSRYDDSMKLLALIALLFSGPIWGWNYDHCLDEDEFDYPSLMDQRILNIVCEVVERNPGWKARIHSDYRHKKAVPNVAPNREMCAYPRVELFTLDWNLLSQHWYGLAVDVRFVSYSGNELTDLRLFRDWVKQFWRTLYAMGVLDEMGLGIYPACRNKFVHMDWRGRRARWGSIVCNRPDYVRWQVAWDWMLRRMEVLERANALLGPTSQPLLD